MSSKRFKNSDLLTQFIDLDDAGQITLTTSGTTQDIVLDPTADVIPSADGTVDIGNTSTRFKKGWFDDVEVTSTFTNGNMTIAADGAVQPATIADASAANNSIYYSSDGSALSYKDSGGTVTSLEGGNPFDQSLNTTDSPTFANLTVTTTLTASTSGLTNSTDKNLVTDAELSAITHSNRSNLDSIDQDLATTDAVTFASGTEIGGFVFEEVA